MNFKILSIKKKLVIAQALIKEFEDENSYKAIYQNILNAVGYTGDIRCGFLISYANFNYLIGFNEYTYFFNSGNLLEALILFFKSKVYIDMMPEMYLISEIPFMKIWIMKPKKIFFR